MSVRDTIILNRHDLKYLLLDSLKLYSEDVVFLGGQNPYQVTLNNVEHYVLIKNVHESGEHRTNQDECRLQLSHSTRLRQLQGNGTLVIVLGYFADEEVFTAWEPRLLQRRFNQRQNVSLYSRFSIQRLAASNGIDQYIDDNGQSVISFRPEYLGLYLENVDHIHQLDAAGLRNLIHRSDSLQQQPQQVAVTIERQRYTVTHTRFRRDPAFRSTVIDAYNYMCAMCGIQLAVVEAAHIVPHSHALGNDLVTNGICLCPLHHKLYDSALVYFTSDHQIHINADKANFLNKLGRSGGLELLRTINRRRLILPFESRQRPLNSNIQVANRIRGIR